MGDQPITRRHLLTSVGAAVLAGAESLRADDPPPTTREALDRLKAGNRRFVEGQTRHAHQGADWRKMLASDQHPFATVIGCSDSRVPPELVFDQGFGDLFIIRVAGNIIDEDVLGSLQYAVYHLRTSLVVVMGHEGCGAVAATLDSLDGKAREPKFIESLVHHIQPGLAGLDPDLRGEERRNAAVEANVRWSVRQLARLPEARRAIEERHYMLVGAVYELKTGRVRLLE